MNCDEVHELIDAHALGALERRQARQLEGHLSRCAECRTLSREAAEVVGQLALAAPQRSAPPALRLRLITRLPAPQSGRRPLLPTVWAAAAAVLLAVSLGSLGWSAFLQNRVNDLETGRDRLASTVDRGQQERASLVATQEALITRQRQMESTLREQDQALAVTLDHEARAYDMVGTGPVAQASARYVWSSEHSMGVLYADDLAAPPSGMTYQFWLITQDRPVSGGTFAPAEDGSAHLLVSDPPIQGPVIAIAVSLEPQGGSEVPSGTTVLRGEPSSEE